MRSFVVRQNNKTSIQAGQQLAQKTPLFMFLVYPCSEMVSLPVLPITANGTTQQKNDALRSLDPGLRRKEKYLCRTKQN